MVPPSTVATAQTRFVPRWPIFQHPAPAYAGAFGLTILACALRWLATPYLGNSSRMGFFVIAMALSAFLFGQGPGLFSTFLGAALAQYFFLGRGHGPMDSSKFITLLNGIGQGVIVSFCAGYLHRVLRSQAEAEVRMRKLYEETHEARESAEALNRTKDYFLAVLSHELRGPLSAIQYCVTSQLRGTALPPEIRDDFRLIDRSARMQSRLISDLLDLTRLSRGKMEIELQPLDLHALLDEAVRTCGAASEGSTGPIPTLRFHAPETWIQGDRDRLLQVLWNILRNAGKFTPAEGLIEVETFEPVPGRVAIRIRDTGMGIPPDQFERIFHPFEQAIPDGGKNHGGLGLGLAIARGIVDLHDGTLTGHSDGAGHGTAFIIDLPTINSNHPPAPSRRTSGLRPAISRETTSTPPLS